MPTVPPCTAALRQKLADRRFLHEEAGSMLIFGLMLFVLMLVMGGIAVDTMRFEQRRTELQNTLDRSTLAAASLTQDLDPEAVVEDYFEKAGLTPYLTGVTVTQGLNYRDVKAQALADTTPYFMHLIGIDDFDAKAVSAAEQRINNVEIVLVLDVSGSMGDPISQGGTKIEALRSAASEFVSTIRANDGENRISIAIVPYNAQVNLDTSLLSQPIVSGSQTVSSKFNAQYPHGKANSNCLEIPSSAYASTTLSRSTAMPITAYADVYNSTSASTAYVSVSSGAPANFWCNVSTNNVVRLPKYDVTALQTQINALTDGGNTSIMLGMKWGLTLLDPGSRPLFDELITEGKIPSNFSGRPFDWVDEDSMKIIVLMTDGEHVAHSKVNDAYKSGLSPIYLASDGYYSIRFTSGRPTASGTNEYWVPHLCTTTNCKSGSNTAEAWRSTAYTPNSTAAVQQTWPEVWAKLRVSWVAWQLYARALGAGNGRNTVYNTWIGNFISTYATVDEMNNQLQQSCTLAKNNGVIVYGIAFEAPTNGQTQIRSCATSDAHYFLADENLSIATVFRAIANNISELRLTQ